LERVSKIFFFKLNQRIQLSMILKQIRCGFFFLIYHQFPIKFCPLLRMRSTYKRTPCVLLNNPISSFSRMGRWKKVFKKTDIPYFWFLFYSCIALLYIWWYLLSITRGKFSIPMTLVTRFSTQLNFWKPKNAHDYIQNTHINNSNVF
jgi:hypothetical protein